jgi:hypothetical protein
MMYNKVAGANGISGAQLSGKTVGRQMKDRGRGKDSSKYVE